MASIVIDQLKSVGMTKDTPPLGVSYHAWFEVWADRRVSYKNQRNIFNATSVMPKGPLDSGEMIKHTMAGENIEVARAKSGLTVRQVKTDKGIPASVWYEARKGRPVSTEYAGRIQVAMPGCITSCGPVNAYALVQTHLEHVERFGSSFATRLGLTTDELAVAANKLAHFKKAAISSERRPPRPKSKRAAARHPIEQLRRDKGFKVRTVAEAIGVGEANWRQRIGKGFKVRRSTSLRLLSVLGERGHDGYDDGKRMEETFGGLLPDRALEQDGRTVGEFLSQSGLTRAAWNDIRFGRPVTWHHAMLADRHLPGLALTSGPHSLAALRARLECVKVLLIASAERTERLEANLLANSTFGMLPEWLEDKMWNADDPLKFVTDSINSLPYWD